MGIQKFQSILSIVVLNPKKIYLLYLLYFNQFLPSPGQHASCHEMSKSRRLVKFKEMKKRNFPLYALKLWAWPQMDYCPGSRASQSCGISSRSKVHPPGNVPCIPSYKLPPYTPIMHHPDIKTSFLKAVLHGINSPIQ